MTTSKVREERTVCLDTVLSVEPAESHSLPKGKLTIGCLVQYHIYIYGYDGHRGERLVWLWQKDEPWSEGRNSYVVAQKAEHLEIQNKHGWGFRTRGLNLYLTLREKASWLKRPTGIRGLMGKGGGRGIFDLYDGKASRWRLFQGQFQAGGENWQNAKK